MIHVSSSRSGPAAARCQGAAARPTIAALVIAVVALATTGCGPRAPRGEPPRADDTAAAGSAATTLPAGLPDTTPISPSGARDDSIAATPPALARIGLPGDARAVRVVPGTLERWQDPVPRTPPPGAPPLQVRLDADTLVCEFPGYTLNCCVDSITPSVRLDGDTLSVRLVEHLTQLCECQAIWRIRFRVAPIAVRPARFRTYRDAAERSYWAGPLP